MADFVLLVIGMNLLCSMLLCDGVFWTMCKSDGRHGEKLLKKWDFHILDLLGHKKCKKKAYIILCWWWKNAHLTSKFCGFARATPSLPFFAEWQSKHPGVAATGWSPSDTHVSHCTSVVVLWSHRSGSLPGHTVLMTQSGPIYIYIYIYIYLYFSSSWVFLLAKKLTCSWALSRDPQYSAIFEKSTLRSIPAYSLQVHLADMVVKACCYSVGADKHWG